MSTFLLVAGCSARTSDDLLVFAAASLRGPLEEAGAAFAAEEGSEVTLNFAGSNVLAQQLVASDRGDVFVSADESWVDYLERHGRAEAGERRYILSNTLVVVAHPSSTFRLDDPSALGALDFAHLSIADPSSVPAGRYARSYLESLGAWDDVRDRVAPAPDVRAALALCATQADVVGIVYRTDARAANVRVLYEVPRDALPTPIRYSAVPVAGRDRIDAASRFVAFLASDRARAIFARDGFVLP